MKSHQFFCLAISISVILYRFIEKFSDAEFIVAILLVDIAYDVECILLELRNKGK